MRSKGTRLSQSLSSLSSSSASSLTSFSCGPDRAGWNGNDDEKRAARGMENSRIREIKKLKRRGFELIYGRLVQSSPSVAYGNESIMDKQVELAKVRGAISE